MMTMEPALMAMQTLCERSWELRPLCETLLGRLVAICGYTDHFRQQDVPPTDNKSAEAELKWPKQVDAALSRFTLLLESLAATESAVFRLAVAPSPVRELRSLHVWLDASFRGLHAEHVDPSATWAQEWEEELERVEQSLQLAARAQVDAAAERTENEQREMIAVVKFAFKQVQDVTRRTKKKRLSRSYASSNEGVAEVQKDDGAELFPDHEESLRVLFRRLVRVCGAQVPVLPSWFLSPAEVALNPSTRFRGGPQCQITSACWMRSRGQRMGGVQQLLIKQLKIGSGDDVKSELALAQAVEAAQRETELLRDVVIHQHVLQLAGASTFGSNPFVAFVSPWAAPEPGSGTVTSLEDYLNLSVDHRRQLFRLLAQAATGLQSFHEASLIHGDLCCANILVGDDGQARLANLRSFSLSRKHPESEPNSTNYSGSLRWQAPELLKSDPKADLASDIYAFGMTLLEALSEELPWGFMADDEVRERVLAGKMPSAPVGVEENVWSLIEAMCDPDQAARPEINTVVEELQALAEEERDRDGDKKNFEDDTTRPLPLHRVSSADYLRAAASPFTTPAKIALSVPDLVRRQSSPTGNPVVKPTAIGIPVRDLPVSPQVDSPTSTVAVVELRQKWLGVKINSIGNRVVVSKFLRAESGAAGEIEASGRVERGDVIVAVNGQSVRGLDRLQIGAIIQSSPRPLDVSFKRDPHLLTDSFRFRGLPMDPRWRDRGSALPLPGSLTNMLATSEAGSSTDPFSIEMWFSLAELGDTFMGGILLGAQDLPFQETSDASGWPYVHQQLLSIDPMGNLWCSFLNRPSSVCVARELSPNHWYHLVVTYGGDAGSDCATFARNDQPEQLLTVYLNGEQRISDAGPLFADWEKLRHVNVGSGCISGLAPAKPEPHFSGWFGFSGLVFDMRVWRRKELSSAQVQLLFRGSSDFIDDPSYSLRRDLLGEAADQNTDKSRRKRSSSARVPKLQGPPFAELVRTTWPRQVGAQVYS
ncbi:TKL/TKL-CCIN protein kinase [Phytophthora megakarya]|uniref:TKL/TKL-CCIN protein kinase n=1 Tax=Phytophthora megakarya TaxID=4795 RepID=A0A225WUQ5_9STRA|nr:TKL/TKL-CCIN protein kinase [Phytophthora megakarya]